MSASWLCASRVRWCRSNVDLSHHKVGGRVVAEMWSFGSFVGCEVWSRRYLAGLVDAPAAPRGDVAELGPCVGPWDCFGVSLWGPESCVGMSYDH